MNRNALYFLTTIALIVLGISVISCKGKNKKSTTYSRVPQKIESLILFKDSINIEAEGKILHYQEISSWDENNFSKILNNKNDFISNKINSFKKKLRKYNRNIINPKVEFNESTKTTTFLCDVQGARYSRNSYEFHWLLGDLPFDLYQFKKSKKELNYEGKVNNVITTIRLVFPFAITHCHEHVWQK